MRRQVTSLVGKAGSMTSEQLRSPARGTQETSLKYFTLAFSLAPDFRPKIQNKQGKAKNANEKITI